MFYLLGASFQLIICCPADGEASHPSIWLEWSLCHCPLFRSQQGEETRRRREGVGFTAGLN